jgi:hypothetical protein
MTSYTTSLDLTHTAGSTHDPALHRIARLLRVSGALFGYQVVMVWRFGGTLASGVDSNGSGGTWGSGAQRTYCLAHRERELQIH